MEDEFVVWVTTRRLKPGSYEDFRAAWRPSEFPEGMIRAFEGYSESNNEVVGVSVWDSAESRERYRLSDVESARRKAMAPFIVEERGGLYKARELRIPGR